MKQQNSPYEAFVCVFADSPEAVISRVKAKLKAFGKDKNVENAEKEMKGLIGKWSSLTNDQRGGVASTLGVIESHIETFAKAKEDPVGAIKGALEIVGSIASNFGPMGQIVGMGLGFVSSILSLFGAGPKPTPISQVVAKEVRKVFEEYRDKELESDAAGELNTLNEIKGYLDGFSRKGIKGSVDITSSRSPVTQGSTFAGKLLYIINGLFEKNEKEQAAKCLKYAELYSRITALRDIIVTQSIAISDDEGDIAGLLGIREVMRLATKVMMEHIYVLNYGSKILPYFDPDNSPSTDAYATAILDLGKYDRSLADGLYCFRYTNQKYLSWATSPEYLQVNQRAFTMFRSEGKTCIWKLVPHGNNTYSIVNRYGCPNDPYCGYMLSFGIADYHPYVTIQNDSPMLWEIKGRQWWR